MKKILPAVLIVAAFISGCTTQPNPNKRPMQQATMESIKTPLPVLTQIPARNGIATTYFAQDSSAAGAQYGLIGALTTAVIDGIANANPYQVAETNANRIADTLKGDELLNQAYSALEANKKNAPAYLDLVFSAPTPAPTKQTKTTHADGLTINIGYVFTADMSGLNVYANVALNAKGIEYKSPYPTQGRKIAKVDKSGLVYQNGFNYYSEQLAVPVKSQADIDAKVAEIRSKAAKNGVVAKRDNPQYSKMLNEIKQAQKAEYTLDEVTTKLADQWLANNGEKLKAEIQAAHKFIAEQVFKDLTRLDIPDYNGTETILTTETDGRVIKLIGAGLDAGKVVSQPKNFVSTSWGNVFVYPDTEKDKTNDKGKDKAKAK